MAEIDDDADAAAWSRDVEPLPPIEFDVRAGVHRLPRRCLVPVGSIAAGSCIVWSADGTTAVFRSHRSERG